MCRETERERERERERGRERHAYTYIYIYIYIADSQVVYTEMVAEQKSEESIPYGSKKHRGSTEKNIPPCVRIA